MVCALLTYIRRGICGIVCRGDIMANRTDYKNQWMKENRDTKLLTLPKGRKAEIQAAADAVGESLNDFICKAIDERMERMERK